MPLVSKERSRERGHASGEGEASVRYLFTCEGCAPEGLMAEEFATRPLVERCLVCGEEASRWYVSAERVLKALLQERNRRIDDNRTLARESERLRGMLAAYRSLEVLTP
jgi:hypothetical protein